MKKLILSLLLLAATLLLIGGAGVQIWYAMQNQKQADLAGAEYLAQGPVVGWRIVCDGMVDPIDGKVQIFSEVEGVIERVEVQEGQRVRRGDVLAVIRGDRQAADVEIARAELALAEAKLGRLEAGTGAEERAAARAKVRAAEEELVYARNELERLQGLAGDGVISADEFEGKQQRVRSLENDLEGLRKEAAAVNRGAFHEELLMAEAEVDMVRRKLERAALEAEKCTVRAPSDGVVLEIFSHAGDTVTSGEGRSILSFANTDRLQVRAEIVEGDVYEVHPGLEGTFVISGLAGNRIGKVVVNRILPDFQSRRLMMTDTRIPVDARTTVALCDITETGFDVYPGQRVTVMFVHSQSEKKTNGSNGDHPELADAGTDDRGRAQTGGEVQMEGGSPLRKLWGRVAGPGRANDTETASPNESQGDAAAVEIEEQAQSGDGPAVAGEEGAEAGDADAGTGAVSVTDRAE